MSASNNPKVRKNLCGCHLSPVRHASLVSLTLISHALSLPLLPGEASVKALMACLLYGNTSKVKIAQKTKLWVTFRSNGINSIFEKNCWNSSTAYYFTGVIDAREASKVSNISVNFRKK
jgi:hypothetical protein